MEVDVCEPAAEVCQKCHEALNECFVKCTQCPNSLILCLKCFSQGEELENHDNSHNYEVHNKKPVRVMLFGNRWTIDEENSLLEAVEHFGFGSWLDVSEFVKTKNEYECEEHYLLYYVDGCIGENTIGSVETAMTCCEKYSGDIYEKSVETQDLTVEQQKDLGYMALRDDFDKDYDNDAESSISSVCLHYTDDAIDVAYKVFQVEQFRERQMDRDKRKVLAKRYNILYDSSHLGFKSFRVNWKKRTREFKAYQNNFLSVAKFMDKSKFTSLFKNMERQKKICRHLNLLLRLSKNGLKKMTGNLKKLNGNLNGKKRRKKIKDSYR